MSPAFCVIVNPRALLYYAKVEPHLFALGPDATPGDVMRATAADAAHSTTPIECISYVMAAWRNHWNFGVVPTQSDCSFYVGQLNRLQQGENAP